MRGARVAALPAGQPSDQLDNLDEEGRLPAHGLRTLGDNLHHIADACRHRAEEISAERATVDALDDRPGQTR